MKDAGIYIGSIFGAYYSKYELGDFSKFMWWQKGLMLFSVLAVTIAFAIFFDRLQSCLQWLTAKIKIKWNGRMGGKIKYRKR